jgi:hypothetical protein
MAGIATDTTMAGATTGIMVGTRLPQLRVLRLAWLRFRSHWQQAPGLITATPPITTNGGVGSNHLAAPFEIIG